MKKVAFIDGNVTINEVYAFIATLEENIKTIRDFIETQLIKDGDIANKNVLFQNIILNYNYLKEKFYGLSNYYVEEKKRYREHFDTSLLGVISSLHQALHFVSMISSSYISETEDVFDIVEALQKRKIIIINVRVIPDAILQVILKNIFEDLIDLNLKESEQRVPVSIFVDEAQRLIGSDIPLDVLRSSRVDVILATQSAFQFISKFKNAEEWNQLSANLSYKVAFKSPLYSSDMNNFFVDTNKLETFEYVKEFENSFYLASPMFLDDKKFNEAEYAYQKNILNIDYLGENEYVDYNVAHFEREREVIIKNFVTMQTRHLKLFSKAEQDVVQNVIKEMEATVPKLVIRNIPAEYKIKEVPEEILEVVFEFFSTMDIDFIERKFDAALDAFDLLETTIASVEATNLEKKVDEDSEMIIYIDIDKECRGFKTSYEIIAKYSSVEEIPQDEMDHFYYAVDCCFDILRKIEHKVFSNGNGLYYLFSLEFDRRDILLDDSPF